MKKHLEKLKVIKRQGFKEGEFVVITYLENKVVLSETWPVGFNE